MKEKEQFLNPSQASDGNSSAQFQDIRTRVYEKKDSETLQLTSLDTKRSNDPLILEAKQNNKQSVVVPLKPNHSDLTVKPSIAVKPTIHSLPSSKRNSYTKRQAPQPPDMSAPVSATSCVVVKPKATPPPPPSPPKR